MTLDYPTCSNSDCDEKVRSDVGTLADPPLCYSCLSKEHE